MFSMAKKFSMVPVVLIAIMAFGANFAPSFASANSVGQCGGEVSTGLQLYNNWKHEGVTSEAAQLVGKPAGFREMDGSFKSFMKNRVAKMTLAETATINDFGCSSGSIFGAGTRTIAKNESVMAAFPLQYSKGNARTTPHQGYKRIVVSVHVVGKVECSNPFEKVVKVFIYVKVPKQHPHHPKHHHPCGCHKTPPTPPKSGGTCNSGDNTNTGSGSAGNCNICVGTNVCNENHESKPPCGCTPVPPPPPVDHAPQISCVFPPHIYEAGGSQSIWCEASDSDGDTLSVNIIGDSHAHVSSTITVNERYDSTPCPSGITCYRSTLWGDYAGVAHIVATVTANGKTGKAEGNVNVEAEEF